MQPMFRLGDVNQADEPASVGGAANAVTSIDVPNVMVASTRRRDSAAFAFM